MPKSKYKQQFGTKPPPRVIIIGAGMSGLACARELQQRRHDVLVVEARSRVGGRVWGAPIESIGDDETVVDLGGALIHGTDGNPLSQLCVQLGIETTEHLSDCLLLDNNGWPVDAKKDDRVSQLFNQALEETFEEIEKLKSKPLNEKEETKINGEPDGEEQQPQRIASADDAAAAVMSPAQDSEPVAPIETSAEGTTKADDDTEDNFGALFDKTAMKQHTGKGTNKLVESALWKWHQANLELSCGASFDALSYTWNDDEAFGYEGAHVALKKSWKTVVEALAEPLNIVHDCPIVAIEIVEDESDPIEETIPAKETEALERKREAAAPVASPSRKSRRLHGDAADVRRSSRTPKQTQSFTVESHSALSYDDVNLEYISKRKAPKPKVRVTLQNGSILQADFVVCTIPLGVLKSETIKFTPPLPERKKKVIRQLGCGLFNKCILSFSHVFWQDSDFLGMAGEDTPFLILNGHKITDKPILIFWFGGESAFDVDEDWQDKDLVEECMSVLRKISKKAPPEPLDYVVTRWGQDAYARMTFSYVPPKVDGHEALATMSEPLMSPLDDTKPMVLFAGEHTTPFHPSTIHGAFLSGIREAYRLDLAIEPTLNGGLVFDPGNLYQKTFVLRKKKDAPTPSQSVIDGASGRARAVVKEEEVESASNGHHRRRHSVMTLRKKKNGTTNGDSNALSPTRQSVRTAADELTSPSLEPSRKSHRKRSAKSPVPYTDTSSAVDEQEVAAAAASLPTNGVASLPQNLAAPTVSQEDRTLKRLIQAYPNWNVIQQKVLPLYGSTKKTSSLKHRYQQLRRGANRSDKSALLDWKIGDVKPKTQQQQDAAQQSNGSRKSSRKAAPKPVVDL